MAEGDQKQSGHPLTLHLSPTSSASVIVTSLTPTPPATTAFAKISPDAEVIVAPKIRSNTGRPSSGESRSVISNDRKSLGGKSGASTVRQKSARETESHTSALYLRPVDRDVCRYWFEGDEYEPNAGFQLWVEREMLSTRSFRGVTYVSVSVLKPSQLREPVDNRHESQTEKAADKVIAKLNAWDCAPDDHTVALSSLLCASLGCKGIVGGLVCIEAAPPQIPKLDRSSRLDSYAAASNDVLRILPFSNPHAQKLDGLKFGGQSSQDRDGAKQVFTALFDGSGSAGVLNGPLTDGMLLPSRKVEDQFWPGGIVRFDRPRADGKAPIRWLLGSERKISIEMQPEVASPTNTSHAAYPGRPLSHRRPQVIGLNKLLKQMTFYLSHSSSVLLTGGIGAGKTSVAELLAHELRDGSLYHVDYLSCGSLFAEDTRISTIKETLSRVFISASWGAQYGGQSLIILDDLHKLCPVETELQVGNENGRSRQISESICSLIRQFCTMDSGVVLLATAQGKEAVNDTLIGGHAFREIVELKAPTKDVRRSVLELLVNPDKQIPAVRNDPRSSDSDDQTRTEHWHQSSTDGHQDTPESHEFMTGDRTLDLLDIAGQTDGYTPGDLALLVSRARSEALIRSVSEIPHSTSDAPISLQRDDFAKALEGFTPASLRNVNLQSSSTRWDSIGGLHSTRRILLETLQYPTTYAPIFAQCPLRLRSGLLLYGYPGCGKTLLASAVAGECGLNFISVKGPEILNKYIGASEKAVRDLFDRAEAARPAVLFFDEFDSIAPKRGHDSTGVTDRVVNQLLTQMDGAEGLNGVYVLAATSRPDLIDPALLRPGRLDKSLLCDMPTVEDRVDILRALSHKVKLDESITRAEAGSRTLQEIARRTEGYSGADLQAVIYNAQLEAIHDVLGVASNGELVHDIGNVEQNTRRSSSQPSPSTTSPDFTFFRVGQALSSHTGEMPRDNADYAERAAIASQIQAVQAHRQRPRAGEAQRRLSDSANATSLGDSGSDTKEPVLQWRHIESALETTRASIGEGERRRLARIYREFVVGRNGEMPNGEGSNEVGGRTSLM